MQCECGRGGEASLYWWRPHKKVEQVLFCDECAAFCRRHGELCDGPEDEEDEEQDTDDNCSYCGGSGGGDGAGRCYMCSGSGRGR